MMNQDYVIDLKVYATVGQDEIPSINMPPELLNESQIKPGIYQLLWSTTEGHLDQFAEAVFENPDLKILGVHRVNI